MAILPDIAIIGGGIFGLSAARAAVERGLRVTLHEIHAPGAGASGGVIGALSPHQPDHWNAKKAFQLDALLSAESWWAGIAPPEVTGFGRTGRIMPLPSAAARARAIARSEDARQHWPDWAEWTVCDPSEDAPFGAVREGLSARIYPPRAIPALADWLRARGVTFAGAADPGEIRAGAVVLAAGWQSAALTPALPDGLLRPVKGQSALLDVDLGQAPILYDDGLYVVPHGAVTAVGSTSENDRSDLGCDAQLEALIARAQGTVPALKGARVLRRWAGLRPRAAFPDPVLGQVPGAPRLWLMSGGFKIGFGLAPRLGTVLLDMIEGRAVALPERFTLAAHLERLGSGRLSAHGKAPV